MASCELRSPRLVSSEIDVSALEGLADLPVRSTQTGEVA